MKRWRQCRVDQIAGKLHRLSDGEIKKIKNYETRHRNWKTLMERIDRALEK